MAFRCSDGIDILYRCILGRFRRGSRDVGAEVKQERGEEMKKFLFVLICLCLVGCATAYKMNRLNLGMTKQGVIKAMGQPNTTKAIGNNEILEYFLYLTGDDAFLGRTRPVNQFERVDLGTPNSLVI